MLRPSKQRFQRRYPSLGSRIAKCCFMLLPAIPICFLLYIWCQIGDSQVSINDAPQVVPKVEVLLEMLKEALLPLSSKNGDQCSWTELMDGYSGGCVKDKDGRCQSYEDLEEAKRACEAEKKCGALTSSKNSGTWQLRQSSEIKPSNTESSYLCHAPVTPERVWETFRSTVESALDDPDLHLDQTFDVREDDSIYLAISTYRDDECPYTLQNAVSRAKHPERLFVGILQQNCVKDCWGGTGWAETRRWVKVDADPDCAAQFCRNNEDYCNSNLRIIRLEEIQAYGPMFGRFLNGRLYRGENFYVQIDSHMQFRENWDVDLIDQIRRTASYPKSIISNYPPSGDAKDQRPWKRKEKEPTPSGMCEVKFEQLRKLWTIRFKQNHRVVPKEKRDTPQLSAFLAAGFFAAHGSIVSKVPFDPFLPYIFMGEEIALAVRFWTNGYDMYAPAEDVVRHHYGRFDGTKFWETVNRVSFPRGSNMHNRLTDLVAPRFSKLLHWDQPFDGSPDSIFTRFEEFDVGKERSVEEFLTLTNLDVQNRKQSAPSWCTRPS